MNGDKKEVPKPVAVGGCTKYMNHDNCWKVNPITVDRQYWNDRYRRANCSNASATNVREVEINVKPRYFQRPLDVSLFDVANATSACYSRQRSRGNKANVGDRVACARARAWMHELGMNFQLSPFNSSGLLNPQSHVKTVIATDLLPGAPACFLVYLFIYRCSDGFLFRICFLRRAIHRNHAAALVFFYFCNLLLQDGYYTYSCKSASSNTAYAKRDRMRGEGKRKGDGENPRTIVEPSIKTETMRACMEKVDNLLAFHFCLMRMSDVFR